MRSKISTAAGIPLAAAMLVVWLASAAQAQTSPVARVLKLTGQVSVMRDTMPWALNVGDSIQPKQLVLTGPDGFAEFQVSDGSTFQVFPNSRVIFREYPSNWTQLLTVLLGRIKVQIQKLGNQPNPNSVHTDTAVISVRGTVFDVVVEDEEGTTFVSVDEGQVEVSNLTAPGRTKMLTPGDSIRVIRNVPLAKTTVDKQSVFRGILNAGAQAMYEILLRTSNGGTAAPGGTGGGGTIGQGDKPKPQPPPTAPPPPPPPPPAPPD